MLFRRNIQPCCTYCNFGMTLGFSEVACSKRGIMSEEGRCGAFRYEPTKRKPEYMRRVVTSKVREEDMRL